MEQELKDEIKMLRLQNAMHEVKIEYYEKQQRILNYKEIDPEQIIKKMLEIDTKVNSYSSFALNWNQIRKYLTQALKE
jgi:hypothetical protein